MDAVAGTCTAKAVAEYWYCSECNKYFSDADCTKETTLEALTGETDPDAHDYGDPTYAWNGNQCTATRACSRACTQGHEQSETVTGTFTEDTPATCTESAKGHYVVDAFANAAFKAPQSSPANSAENGAPLGHTMTPTEAKAATCVATGNNAYYTCGRCKVIFKDNAGTTATTVADETLPALGHTMTPTEAKAATCVATGNNAYYTCKTCKVVFKDNAGTTATTVADETLPALGHAYVDHAAQAPTCTAIGWDAYRTCKNCDYTEYAEKPATGHVWADEYEEILPAECDAPGLEARPCKNCDLYDEGREIPAPGHDWSKKDGFCATCGMPCDNSDQHGENVCPVCGYSKPKAEPAVVKEAESTISENVPVDKVVTGLSRQELKQAGIFTEAELKQIRAGKPGAVYFVVTETAEAPSVEDLSPILSFAPRGAMTLDLRLMKRVGQEEPVEVSRTEPIPMTLTLKPETIPEGTTGILVLLSDAEEPIECEFNAETGEITFTTQTYGLMTFVFI